MVDGCVPLAQDERDEEAQEGAEDEDPHAVAGVGDEEPPHELAVDFVQEGAEDS